MNTLRRLVVVAVGIVSAVFFVAETSAQSAPPAKARNVVLVHGAWADGSSWADVIPRLQAAGLNARPCRTH